jgi:(3,5-dihydroxyphenyl)acetyl-CoA 1,2-dioxygenase
MATLASTIAPGLPEDDLARWEATRPSLPAPGTGSAARLDADAAAASIYFRAGEELIGRLPPKSRRTPPDQAAAQALHAALRGVRLAFLRAYVEPLYSQLTQAYSRFVRVDALVYAAATRVPGLVPSRAEIEAERQQQQKDKDGLEIDQGVFLSQVMSHPRAGLHLVHGMLRPLPASLDLLTEFRRTGRVDIGPAYAERSGAAGYVYLRNTRFLNAEDDQTTPALETAVDLVLLDPDIQVGVLRGATVDHPRYAGRHVFNAGINLTHLYHGRIGFVDFFMARDMGFVNKMFRGLSSADFIPNEQEDTQEKPWIAAVEAFAIGGGCQLLLVMDHVLAERSSFFTLPARKEGIIPGVSNMRLWRAIGDRMARQAILFDRRFEADSASGQMICDTLVEDGEMDAAVTRTVEALTTSGLVSAAGNRKAMRMGQETLDQFRQYMAVYAREQAMCTYSPQLIQNLELNWNAHQRKP